MPDITVPGAHESRLRENLIESGVRAILAVPMVCEGRLIGSLVVSRNQPGDFPTEAIELLRTFVTPGAEWGRKSALGSRALRSLAR